jgi:hypothetical protein
MERLGAFYRLRAGETANPDRGAYAYQALDWLQRAAAIADDGRPETARARDDASLALGQMLAHGEGGRAPDPAAAEARLRQAAAGSRADAVLALGQFLESQAGGDADRLAEARGLYARVAQLGDASALQREGRARPRTHRRDGQAAARRLSRRRPSLRSRSRPEKTIGTRPPKSPRRSPPSPRPAPRPSRVQAAVKPPAAKARHPRIALARRRQTKAKAAAPKSAAPTASPKP